MISRFFQLILLAGMILLIPSFLYLSHPAQPTLVDPATGLAYSSDSILQGQTTNDLAQVSQGKGAEQAHLWNGWNWQDASANVNKGVHQVEDRVKNLIEHWRPTAGPASQSSGSGSKVKPAPNPSSSSTTAVKDIERIDGVIMPKMANATAKAALGRSTWHFLHTMTLRFPDKPTKQESETLRTFFENFAQLYPCGECARHFQQLIKDLPPQVGSRIGASLWLCSVHNEVNKSLGKDEFPCDKLDESYDCGCGDDKGKDGKEVKDKAEVKVEKPTSAHEGVTPFA